MTHPFISPARRDITHVKWWIGNILLFLYSSVSLYHKTSKREREREREREKDFICSSWCYITILAWDSMFYFLYWTETYDKRGKNKVQNKISLQCNKILNPLNFDFTALHSSTLHLMHRAEQSAIMLCLTYTIFNSNVFKNVFINYCSNMSWP